MRSAAGALERATAQAFSSTSDKAALADRLDDRVLGGEEPIDIGGRHAQFGRDVGDRGLGKAQPTEQRLRGFHDPRAGIVGFGSDLRIHRAAYLWRIVDDE